MWWCGGVCDGPWECFCQSDCWSEECLWGNGVWSRSRSVSEVEALVARARELRPRLPVVVASGWAQSGDGYVALAKPYDSAGLRAAVDAALAG